MAAPMEINVSQLRVSSVLNRDVKQYGKKFLVDGNEDTCWNSDQMVTRIHAGIQTRRVCLFLVDGNEDTCWNSDQGAPQWITIDFEGAVVPVDLSIQFQGGFAGDNCWIEGKVDSNSDWEKIEDCYPKDNNSLQTFKINSSGKNIVSMKIVFGKSTDFFGRITIYQLKVNGEVR